MSSEHIGSSFDDFLAEDGSLEEVTAMAVKRVIAWQLAQAMKAQHISKTEMAARMHTSRMVVNRLLDERDTSVTLATLARASVAVGLPLRFELAGAGA
jgi:predicted XRE-type DNA-binding protein